METCSSLLYHVQISIWYLTEKNTLIVADVLNVQKNLLKSSLSFRQVSKTYKHFNYTSVLTWLYHDHFHNFISIQDRKCRSIKIFSYEKCKIGTILFAQSIDPLVPHYYSKCLSTLSLGLSCKILFIFLLSLLAPDFIMLIWFLIPHVSLWSCWNHISYLPGHNQFVPHGLLVISLVQLFPVDQQYTK